MTMIAPPSTAMFCAWAQAAAPGEWVCYHFGNLARDRVRDAELSQLAEAVLILEGTGMVKLTQTMVNAIHETRWQYAAIRCAGGYCPPGLSRGEISPVEYRALQAVLHKAPREATQKAIRDGVKCSDAAAVTILNALRDRGLLVPQDVQGWKLSPDAMRLMV